MNNNENKKNEVLDELNSFLNDEKKESEVSKIKNDNSILERINKKIITEDGRQLLIN